MNCIKFRQKHCRKSEATANSGQAMLEFILGLMIMISFFFFFVRMSAVFAVGNYIHYATFMAARAYESSDVNTDAQTQNANKVLGAMLTGRFKNLIKAKGGSGSVPGAAIGPGPYFSALDDNWNQGVTFEYTATLSMLPWSSDGQSVKMDLTSESWLSREETQEECQTKKTSIGSLLGQNGVSNVAVEFDNGC